MAPDVQGVRTRPEGATVAFLLIHGFCAAPDELATLGEYLSDMGVASFAVQIAGHGTSPDDLKQTSWHDWYFSAKQGIEEVKSWGMEKVFVAGFSMGGALSTLLVAEVNGIDGLVLIAPALRIHGIMPKLVPILKFVMRERKIDLEAIQQVYDIKRTKYDREPVSAYHELFKLQKNARNSMNRVTIPTLILQGTADRTINPENGKLAFDGISSTDKELHMIEGAEHVISCHPTRKDAYPFIKKFVLRLTS
ncbi:MAG: alpha/beta hydrolase [Candidatus Thorarchaeota archaeon]